MNPFDPFPQEITGQFFLAWFLIALALGAGLAWPIARCIYLKAGKREGLGMLRRDRQPNNL